MTQLLSDKLTKTMNLYKSDIRSLRFRLSQICVKKKQVNLGEDLLDRTFITTKTVNIDP